MTSPVGSIACPAAAESRWMASTRWAMSPVARAVSWARSFASVATTAKPLPAAPARARAASIVALSASRLVCSAISRAARSLVSPATGSAMNSLHAWSSPVFAACTFCSAAAMSAGVMARAMFETSAWTVLKNTPTSSRSAMSWRLSLYIRRSRLHGDR